MLLGGCRKTPICCVTLIPRHCGVLLRTPHSSGFRKPCIWTFSISLSEANFSRVSFLSPPIHHRGIIPAFAGAGSAALPSIVPSPRGGNLTKGTGKRGVGERFGTDDN
jgi:hypothetical protein